MSQRFQRFTKRYASLIGVLIGLTVVSSILLYSGCGMTSSPNIPTPTPTPTPAPTPTPDTATPTSTIMSPTAGATVLIGTRVAITGTASDAGGGSVVRVEVSVDGGANFSAATGTNAWSFSWTPNSPGQATIKSRAVDNSGNVQNPQAEIQVIVDAPPTSTITSPTGGAFILIGTPVVITGTASDPGGGSVVRVEVSVNGGVNYSAATGTNSWSFNWTPSFPQPVRIKSRAVDNTGNVQNPPAEIQVTVDAPPISTIESPPDGATVAVGIPVNITGTAFDPGLGTVVKVEVSVDGGATFSNATGTNPWSFNWTPSAPGPATIRSRAFDSTGNQQVLLEQISVTVRTPITIRVPTDQLTIQAAINVAEIGDTVVVAPGTYVENINFGGKTITVRSESGPQVTIIDGGNVNPVVIFTSQAGRNSVINGFTLQNGRGGEGGGIFVENSSPTITNNVIRSNQACDGGGIGIRFGSPLIQLNTITGNGNNLCGGFGGGGIKIGGASSAEILDNVISDNVGSNGGGIHMFAAGTPIIKRNIIKGNTASNGQGGGLYMVNVSDALIVQNLITGNQAHTGGGIYWLVPSPARGPILVNNTIADNHATSLGSGIFADGFDARTELTNNIIVAKPGQSALHCGDSNAQSQPIIRFNNIFSLNGMAYGGICSNKTGTDGNISADPIFTNPTQGDYHLQQVSSSIDAGDNLTPNLPDTDIDGDPRVLDGDANGTATIDMGVDEFPLPPGSTTPISTIRSPVEGATVATETTISITGLARDAGGGTVALVEVSVDGGATWNPATGTTAWSYDWTPTTPGPATIKSRAVDDSGNVQDPPAEITVTVRDPVIIRVPSDQQTIQLAINVAAFGDTVLVAPGIYVENINFGGKAITVRSESGPQDTIIDGGNADSVVVFTSGERRDSVLNGFTLQNGRRVQGPVQGTAQGGGIRVEAVSSPTITNNVIRNNQACNGGGISIASGSPLIQLNTITSNGNSGCNGGSGGGIGIVGPTSAEILDNVISDNTSLNGGGINLSVAGTPIIKRNIIKGNNAMVGLGGGIFIISDSNPLIVQNLITGNQAHNGGGLYWARTSPGPTLVNNTIADNDAISIGSGIFAEGFGARTELTNNIIVAKPGQTGLQCGPFITEQPIIRFNNIFSSGGMAYSGSCSNKTGTDGNISADPRFTNPAQGDYHLQQGSPSIDTGYNQAPNLLDTDIDGDPRILDGDGNGTAIVDMGVDEFLAPALRSVFRMRATVIRRRAGIRLLDARESP
jgi:Big-like domain-containing protein/parallel beta helix pectate lyase-like protein